MKIYLLKCVMKMQHPGINFLFQPRAYKEFNYYDYKRSQSLKEKIIYLDLIENTRQKRQACENNLLFRELYN